MVILREKLLAEGGATEVEQQRIHCSRTLLIWMWFGHDFQM